MAEPTPAPGTPHPIVQAIASWVADDALAITFQSLGQYRSALLQFIATLAALPVAAPPAVTPRMLVDAYVNGATAAGHFTGWQLQRRAEAYARDVLGDNTCSWCGLRHDGGPEACATAAFGGSNG